MIETLNRAFLYGESVFTTLRMVDGHLQDWDAHYDRLKKGVEFVYGPFPETENWNQILRDRLEASCVHESGDKIVRFTVYRHQARGLRRLGVPSVGDLKIHCSASAFEAERVENRQVSLKSCAAMMRPQWWPSYLKAGSYLDVILAQKQFLSDKNADDDLLFLSHRDTLLESSVANIFVVRHNKLFTAPVGPNVLDGVMRKKVLERAGKWFEEVREEETTMEQALKADAIFGTNSVRGPFLVRALDGYVFHPPKDFLEKFADLRASVMR